MLRIRFERISARETRFGTSRSAGRAGAALPGVPAETDESDAYIQKVIAAGGFGRYERAHLNAIAAIFVPEFAHRSLPPEIVRRVVEYAFHVGDY